MGGSICGIQKKERLNDIGNVIIIPKFDKNFIEEKKNGFLKGGKGRNKLFLIHTL